MQTADSVPGTRLTPIQWLICVIAAIGFAFDIYELLMLPLIVRPALLELIGAAPGSPEFQMWVGRLFYIPAFAGGIFGLLGGYLTDRLGRRRVLTWSILHLRGLGVRRRGSRPRSRCCCSCAAWCSSACASSSSRPSPGWPSCSPTRSSARRCSATRRRSRRSADCWWRRSTAAACRLRRDAAGARRRSDSADSRIRTRRGATR